MKALATSLCCFLFLVSAMAQDEKPRREAAEIRARGGIPNVLRKARIGDTREIRVAYFGGSITAAPGWRVKSLETLKQRFPAVKWSEINAAIGGTGSDLGVFRMGQDVLAHKPDLIFVEFAVNDGGADPLQIHKAMEGIVRQAWTADAETDIVFVYTISEPFLADLQAGKCSRAASAMEEIADHYKIPTIHFGIEVAKRAADGNLIFKGEAPDKNAKADASAPMVFSTDGVHPLVETGHILYNEALFRAWTELEKAPAATAAAPHPLGDPFRPDHWATAKLVPLKREMLTGEWTKLDGGEKGDEIARRFAKFLPQLWRAEKPGATLTFRYSGEVVGFYDLAGPDSGQLKVKIDGGDETIVPRIDAYSTYHRLSKFPIANGDDGVKVHTVSVTLDATIPDKKTILFEKNRSDLEKNPAKYAPNLWNVGAIMLIGEAAE